MRGPRIGLVVLQVATLLLFTGPVAAAHGSFTAGKYNVKVGWQNEPPTVDQSNAITIEVTDTTGGGSTPVTGLTTLQAEAIFGGESRTLDLTESDDTQGLYFAGIIPTAKGDFSIKVTGNIKGTNVDKTIKVEAVEGTDSLSFPDTYQSRADEANAIALLRIEALGAAGLALILAIVALIMALGATRKASAAGGSRATAPTSSTASRPSTAPPATRPAPPRPR